MIIYVSKLLYILCFDFVEILKYNLNGYLYYYYLNLNVNVILFDIMKFNFEGGEWYYLNFRFILF